MVPPVHVPHLPGRGAAVRVELDARAHLVGAVAEADEVVGHLAHDADGAGGGALVAELVHLLPLHQYVRHLDAAEQLGGRRHPAALVALCNRHQSAISMGLVL